MNKGKFIDLLEMSRLGTLQPPCPSKFMLKYNPPKISLIYHFEHKPDDEYYHDVYIEKRMLESSSAEEICSHLYLTEDFYFNPKQIKRAQVEKLIIMLKENFGRAKVDAEV